LWSQGRRNIRHTPIFFQSKSTYVYGKDVPCLNILARAFKKIIRKETTTEKVLFGGEWNEPSVLCDITVTDPFRTRTCVDTNPWEIGECGIRSCWSYYISDCSVLRR
jgi:hypothetical protein